MGISGSLERNFQNFREWWCTPATRQDRVVGAEVGGIAGLWIGVLGRHLLGSSSAPFSTIVWWALGSAAAGAVLGILLPKVAACVFFPFWFFREPDPYEAKARHPGFDWYIREVNKQKAWATYRDRYLCPCCAMPTLSMRAGFEFCEICFWEDDGQDSDDADIVRGGPNHDYSLTEARENFRKHLTMYGLSDERPFAMDQRTRPNREKLYRAYQSAMQSDSDERWKAALELEKRYQGIGRIERALRVQLPEAYRAALFEHGLAGDDSARPQFRTDAAALIEDNHHFTVEQKRLSVVRKPGLLGAIKFVARHGPAKRFRRRRSKMYEHWTNDQRFFIGDDARGERYFIVLSETTPAVYGLERDIERTRVVAQSIDAWLASVKQMKSEVASET